LYQLERPSPATIAARITARNRATINGRGKVKFNCAGPTNVLRMTSKGATKRAICMELPNAIPRLRSILFLAAIDTAEILSAAPPTIARKMTPISVAERSLPLLNLLEMLYQPRAQLLLGRWGQLQDYLHKAQRLKNGKAA